MIAPIFESPHQFRRTNPILEITTQPPNATLTKLPHFYTLTLRIPNQQGWSQIMQSQFTSHRRVKGCVGSTPLKTRSQRNDQCQANKWCNRGDRQDSLLHCVNRIGRKFLTSRLITSSVRTSHCLPYRFIIIFRSFNKTELYGHPFPNHFGYNAIFFYNYPRSSW